MRDCFSQHSVQISGASSSSSSSSSCSDFNPKISCVSPALCNSHNNNTTTPSTRYAVVCLHRVLLSNQEKHMLITVTWTKHTPSSQGLAIRFDQDNAFELDTNNSRKLFRKLRGNKSVELPHCSSRIQVFWDFSSARYKPGPEPSGDFYLVIAFDSEIGLILGDAARCAVSRKLKQGTRTAGSSLVSRKEYYSGRAVYSTRARLCHSGRDHDVLIRCCEEKDGPVLLVRIDETKVVIRVERLRWNFRGHRAIFLDGLLVDVTWDVHDWFESGECGKAIFTFRARGRLGRGLWTEDHKLVGKDVDEDDQFSLMMICECKDM